MYLDDSFISIVKRKAEVMGKNLSIQREEMPAHLPMLQSNLISILPEEKDYV